MYFRQSHCSVDGCKNKHRALGYCEPHYRMFKRRGRPERVKTANGECRAFVMVALNYKGDDCLIWPFGSGGCYPTVGWGGRSRLVHRVVCELAHGKPQNETMQSAHSCGNGKDGCVNPRHLRWATPKENQADRIIHGTHDRGERSSRAKLTEKQVREIWSLKGRYFQRELAERYGVSQSLIGMIFRKKAWAWLDGNGASHV